MELQLAGKCALVTGGSRGIGRSIVLELAQQGVRVAACYHRESDAVTSLAAELDRVGKGSLVIQADVSDESSVTALATTLRERFGQLHVLVNNAGVVSHRTLADLDLAEWRRVLDTNLTSMYLVTRAVLDMLVPGSSVINVTSGVATAGMAARTHYTASKAGVNGFTRALCKELGPRNIRVNGIAPGIIETDQVAGLTPEQRARYANFNALARLGEPKDIANVALFLASDLARFVTGVTIQVDGGI